MVTFGYKIKHKLNTFFDINKFNFVQHLEVKIFLSLLFNEVLC